MELEKKKVQVEAAERQNGSITVIISELLSEFLFGESRQICFVLARSRQIGDSRQTNERQVALVLMEMTGIRLEFQSYRPAFQV